MLMYFLIVCGRWDHIAYGLRHRICNACLPNKEVKAKCLRIELQGDLVYHGSDKRSRNEAQGNIVLQIPTQEE
jgi:hypothetical protein